MAIHGCIFWKRQRNPCYDTASHERVGLYRSGITFIKTHWTGRTDFIWLIVVNLFCVRLVIHLIGINLINAPAGIWYVLFPFMVLALIWQIIGTARAAKSGLDQPDGIFKIIALFVAIMAVIITTSWQMIDQYHYLFDPEPEPFVDPAIITLARSNDGHVLFISGPITLKQYNAFRDLDDINTLRQVTLDSTGGNIFAARGFYRLIRERGLNTHVDGKCYSACTVIFVAGNSRTADPFANFGFHGYAYNHEHTGQSIDVAAQQRADVELFTQQGIPISFVNKIFATPSIEMWHPTRVELLTSKVLN